MLIEKYFSFIKDSLLILLDEGIIKQLSKFVMSRKILNFSLTLKDF